MKLLRWCVGGLIGGLAGGALWVGVGVVFNAEIGILATVVGLAVGVGVRLTLQSDEEGEREVAGGVALLLSIATVLAAKYVGWALVFGSVSQTANLALQGDAFEPTRENLILTVAEEIVEDLRARSQPIDWPAGVTSEEAFEKEHYPGQIWETAEKRWDKFPPEEKRRREQVFAESNEALKELLGSLSFWSSFSFYDILWFGLAAGAAVGVVLKGDED